MTQKNVWSTAKNCLILHLSLNMSYSALLIKNIKWMSYCHFNTIINYIYFNCLTSIRWFMFWYYRWLFVWPYFLSETKLFTYNYIDFYEKNFLFIQVCVVFIYLNKISEDCFRYSCCTMKGCSLEWYKPTLINLRDHLKSLHVNLFHT